MSMTASRKAHTEIIDWWTLLSESSQVARETAESVSTEIIGEAAEDAEAAAEDARTAAAGADAAAASISQAISEGIATEAAARESADAAMLESIAAEADRATSAEQTNAAAIAVLNGTGAGSVSRAVSDGIASVISGAPQSLDTLKEIADWIDGHADDAAAMNSAIRQNAGNIAAEESARQAADTALSEGKQAKALSSPVEFGGATYTQLEPLLSAVASTANEVNGKAEDNTLNFAPAFSEVTSYAVGSYVTYSGKLYKCTTAHTAGAWVAGHFTQVTVGEDLSASLNIEYTDLAPYLLTGWSVREYVRGYKIGKMAIIDFGGLTSSSDVSAGQNQYIMKTLPYSIKNRAVTTLFSDDPSSSKKMTVYVVESAGTIFSDLRANYPALSAWSDNLYGQMIIALN